MSGSHNPLAELRAAFAALTGPVTGAPQQNLPPMRKTHKPHRYSSRPGGRPETNITSGHKRVFSALVTASETDAPFTLFSCFVNGEPTSAICLAQAAEDGMELMPLFVAITPGMALTDHDGQAAGHGRKTARARR